MPNCCETVEAMLAAASIGAIWSSTAPDFGDKVGMSIYFTIYIYIYIGGCVCLYVCSNQCRLYWHSLKCSDSISYRGVCKVGDYSRGRPKGSLFNSYYTKV